MSLFTNICHFRPITNTNNVAETGQSCRCYYLSRQEECLWKDRDVSGKECSLCVCVCVCVCTSVSLINLDLEIVFHVLLGIRGYRGQFAKNCSFSGWYLFIVTTWETSCNIFICVHVQYLTWQAMHIYSGIAIYRFWRGRRKQTMNAEKRSIQIRGAFKF